MPLLQRYWSILRSYGIYTWIMTSYICSKMTIISMAITHQIYLEIAQ